MVRWDTLIMVGRGSGDVELASGRALSPFSQASWTAADNLVTKAVRTLAEGDDERWLDAALDVVDSGGDVARSAMRGVLADIRQDFEISGVSHGASTLPSGGSRRGLTCASRATSLSSGSPGR